MKKFINLLSVLISMCTMAPSHAMLLRNKLNTAQLGKTALLNNKKFKTNNINRKKYSEKTNNNDKDHRQLFDTESFSKSKKEFKKKHQNYKKFSLSRLIGFSALVSAFYAWWNDDEKKETEKKNEIFSTESLEKVPSYIQITAEYEDLVCDERNKFSYDEEYLRYVLSEILLEGKNPKLKRQHVIQYKEDFTRFTINEIVKTIYLEKEKKNNNKIILYHGMSGENFVLLDIYSRLYNKINNQKNKSNNFFFRIHGTCKELPDDWYNNFIRYKRKKFIKINNLEFNDTSEIRDHQISCNFFILGNTRKKAESSFDYAMDSRNNKFYILKDSKTINQIQSVLNIDIIPYIKEILDESKKHGVLLQIEAPSSHVYQSGLCGNPTRYNPKEFNDIYQNLDKHYVNKAKVYESYSNSSILPVPAFSSRELSIFQARFMLDKSTAENPLYKIHKIYPHPDAHEYYNKKYEQKVTKIIEEILNAMTPLEKKIMEKDPFLEWQNTGLTL